MAARKRTAYVVEGNTVRKAEYEEVRRRRTAQAQQKHVARAYSRAMNLIYLFFLVASLAAGAIVLTYYIMLQTQLTRTAGNIAALEKQLSTLTKENDETYNRINGNLDLEEIRRIAIQEYGMKYVEEGQIVTYSDGGGSDYVRQKAEIPSIGD